MGIGLITHLCLLVYEPSLETKKQLLEWHEMSPCRRIAQLFSQEARNIGKQRRSPKSL